MPLTNVSLCSMTNFDICIFSLIFSFDINRALRLGGMADIVKVFPYAADSPPGLSQYTMSPAPSAYFSWLLAA